MHKAKMMPTRGPEPPNPASRREAAKSKPERPIAMAHRPAERKHSKNVADRPPKK